MKEAMNIQAAPMTLGALASSHPTKKKRGKLTSTEAAALKKYGHGTLGAMARGKGKS